MSNTKALCNFDSHGFFEIDPASMAVELQELSGGVNSVCPNVGCGSQDVGCPTVEGPSNAACVNNKPAPAYVLHALGIDAYCPGLSWCTNFGCHG